VEGEEEGKGKEEEDEEDGGQLHGSELMELNEHAMYYFCWICIC
jgi:hypothetical protein